MGAAAGPQKSCVWVSYTAQPFRVVMVGRHVNPCTVGLPRIVNTVTTVTRSKDATAEW